MFMPYMCMALVLFSETIRTAAYSHLHKYHMLGLHVTNECLGQLFVRFLTLLRMLMSYWGRGSLSV